MLSLRSLSAYWHKPMSKRTICYRYCRSVRFRTISYTDTISAELEMTVNMLIQIDKLVQLLESPVFTCRSSLRLERRFLTAPRFATTAS